MRSWRSSGRRSDLECCCLQVQELAGRNNPDVARPEGRIVLAGVYYEPGARMDNGVVLQKVAGANWYYPRGVICI